MFKHVPNGLETLHEEEQKSLMDGLRGERDMLGLHRRTNKLPVQTQWIVAENVMESVHSPLPLEEYPFISKLITLANNRNDTIGRVNGCLVNYYAPNSGRRYPHSDDESYVNQGTTIATFSMDSDREFNIYDKATGKVMKSYILKEKSLFIMYPGAQSLTKHLVMCNANGSGGRWSFSLREIIPTTPRKGEWPYTDMRLSHKEKSHVHESRVSTKDATSTQKSIKPGNTLTRNDREHAVKKRPRRILLIGDSLLNQFRQDLFGETFECTKLQPGSWKNLDTPDNLRRVLSHHNIDCYMICLGTNDLRESYTAELEDHVINVIEYLVKRSHAKIILSLPKRTRDRCQMDSRVMEFKKRTMTYIDQMKEKIANPERLCVSTNDRFNDPDIMSKSKDIFSDNIHLSARGTAVLAFQMKKILCSSFGIPVGKGKPRNDI